MSHPLLTIADLRTWFPVKRGVFGRTVGHIKAVDGVSLTVQTGETVGLVGESGCGKSTLARSLVKLETPVGGTITFDGASLEWLKGEALRQLRQRIQIVFQDPFASLNPRMTIVDIITEAPIAHKLISPREREVMAVEWLADVGLGRDALHRYPHEFSGGQRQRISIARAIATKPKLIICDEAVSALDVSVQAQVINLLMDLKDKHELSYLFISHDLGVVRHISDRVAVMYLGHIVEQGPTATVIDSPGHPYTQALVSAIPRVGSRGSSRIVLAGDVPSPINPPDGCPFHPRCPFAKPECRSKAPALEPHGKAEHHTVGCLRKDELAPN